MHARDSLLVCVAQLDAAQLRRMTDRDCEPPSSQVPEKLPQAPHVPYVVEPQLVPSVSRAQAMSSVVLATVHMPLLQRGVITLRLRIPVSSQVFSYPPHELHAPIVGAPQSESITHSSQVLVVSLQNIPHGGALCAEQEPAAQVSLPLQKKPSSQAAAFGADMHAPLIGSQVSSVHSLPSSQTMGCPAQRRVSVQTSASVHALPSSHAMPTQSGSAQSISPSQSSSSPSAHEVSVGGHIGPPSRMIPARGTQPTPGSHHSSLAQRVWSPRMKHSESAQNPRAQLTLVTQSP